MTPMTKHLSGDAALILTTLTFALADAANVAFEQGLSHEVIASKLISTAYEIRALAAIPARSPNEADHLHKAPVEPGPTKAPEEEPAKAPPRTMASIKDFCDSRPLLLMPKNPGNMPMNALWIDGFVIGCWRHAYREWVISTDPYDIACGLPRGYIDDHFSEWDFLPNLPSPLGDRAVPPPAPPAQGPKIAATVDIVSYLTKDADLTKMERAILEQVLNRVLGRAGPEAS